MTLTDFLLARIAEDEEVARDAYYEGQRWAPEEEAVVSLDRDLDVVMLLDRKSDAWFAADWSPARVLAECDAKRRIVDWGAPLSSHIRREPTERPGVYNTFIVRYPTDEGEDVLRLLALPYADHPDYDETWRP